ncbi:fructose-bisphosphatase class III [Staphylococcus aureus]
MHQIINLESILTLPKGTEHFSSAIYMAKYQAFEHVLRNGSGMCERKSMIFSKDKFS